MSWLGTLLGVSPETNHQVASAAEKLQTVTEFLDKAVDKLRNSNSISEAIEASAPWLEDVADAVGEAIPPVKLILKVVGLITKETNPRTLGLLAFSLAYQQSLVEATKLVASTQIDTLRSRDGLDVSAAKKLLKSRPRETPDAFDNFRLGSCLRHPLIIQSDQTVQRALEALGYSPTYQRVLVENIHLRFPSNFRLIITDGKVKDKFDALFRLLMLDEPSLNAFSIIERHTEYQAWRFSKSPILGTGGPLSLQCTLQDIYVPLDCGILRWEEIRGSGPTTGQKNPFDETSGGRVSLMTAVLGLLGDPDFDDAVVIQGIAGAGKSAFTLALCAELRRLGLRPVRIRMRDLTLDPRVALIDDVVNAVIQNSGDTKFDQELGPRPSPSDVSFAHIFDESVMFGESSDRPKYNHV